MDFLLRKGHLAENSAFRKLYAMKIIKIRSSPDKLDEKRLNQAKEPKTPLIPGIATGEPKGFAAVN